MTAIQNLSVRQRLIALCVFLCLITLVPLSNLFLNQKANWDFNAAEQRGIEPANTLVQAIAQVQRHRGLSGPWLQDTQDANPARGDAATKAESTWKAFDQQWQSTGLDDKLLARSGQLRNTFMQLQQRVAARSLPADESFQQHTALVDEMLGLLFDVSGSANLLFDPQDTTYLMIIAGFQEGPRITELAARMRGLGTGYLSNQGGFAHDIQLAMDTHGRLLERIAHLQTHLKAVAQRRPDLGKRIAEPAMAKLEALRALSQDTRAMLQGASDGPIGAMKAKDYFAYATQIIDEQTAITRQVTQEVNNELADRQSDIQQQALWQGLLVAMLAGIGLWLMAALIRSILQPIERMGQLAKALASGDLTVNCGTNKRDEIATCMNALESARLSWGRMLHDLRASITTVTHASNEIASGSQDLNERTNAAASSLQQTSGAIQHLTGTVQQTATSAAQADVQARSARDTAELGQQVMSQVVSNMNNISTASRKIADIIGVIDGIAFQTNILALNAAVEAARAGESGKGFAVVASEVRSLAQRSAQSAREIKTLINDSLDKVETGTQLVNDAGSSMQAIMGSNQQVTDIIGSISQATRDQSTGFVDVNDAILNLDGMTTQNAALVQQSSEAAGNLRDQAERLTQLISVFKYDATTH